MKQINITILFFVCISCCLGQNVSIKHDSSFLNLFSRIAFQRATDNIPMLRKWNQNINICLEGVQSNELKDSIKKSLEIPRIQEQLNGISINWVTDKTAANYLIRFDTTGRNYYYLNWDRGGNIYNCLVTINTKFSFSVLEQIRLVRNYFLCSLGHFYFQRGAHFQPLNSCLYSLLNNISEFDENVLKLEYDKELRAGMSISEFNELVYKWKYTTAIQ